MHAALVAAAVLTAGVGDLPPSLDKVRIRDCAPATIDAASDCLAAALSPKDLDLLLQPGNPSGFRGFLDEHLRQAWSLRDPESPLAREMRALKVYHPEVAPALVIDNLSYRRRGGRLDLGRVAEAMASWRRPADREPSQQTGAGPAEARERLPDAACATVPIEAGARLVGCYRNPDGTIAAAIDRVEPQLNGTPHAD